MRRQNSLRLNNFMGLLIKCLFLYLLGSFLPAQAKIFEWHTTNIQLLQGWTHELGDRTRTVISLQHTNKWRYGDNYAFMDITDLDGVYAEVHPQLSLGKITGQSFSVGPIADILFASTFEFTKGPNRYLFGFGIDWKVPYFKYLKSNFYIRDNTGFSGTTEQVTISWGLPLAIGDLNLLFDGFADITGSEGPLAANEHIQASALIDVGNYWDFPQQVYLGTEYIYWHNKFGLSEITESVFQLQLRYVF